LDEWAWTSFGHIPSPPGKKYGNHMKSALTSFLLIEDVLFFLLSTEIFTEPRELLLPLRPYLVMPHHP